ncbi:MAG: hypothetical protein KDD69_05020 [Bdellovibrionales bacterium]|nr:hypothetical protein [Bdellovibrionales bacterium]
MSSTLYDDLHGMGVALLANPASSFHVCGGIAGQFPHRPEIIEAFFAEDCKAAFHVASIVDALPAGSEHPVAFALPGRQHRELGCWTLLEQKLGKELIVRFSKTAKRGFLKVYRRTPTRRRAHVPVVKQWKRMPELAEELDEAIDRLSFEPTHVGFQDLVAYRLALVIRELKRRNRATRLLWGVGSGCGIEWDTTMFSWIIQPTATAKA